jgi:L-methionine (R)-S-oxide reductase
LQGFYQTDPLKPSELVIAPYQGSLACLRIPYSRGVCGAAACDRKTQLVDNVHLFAGHIACASSTESEIVVPVVNLCTEEVMAVLDLDSNTPAAFNQADVEGLEAICTWMAQAWGEKKENGN